MKSRKSEVKYSGSRKSCQSSVGLANEPVNTEKNVGTSKLKGFLSSLEKDNWLIYSLNRMLQKQNEASVPRPSGNFSPSYCHEDARVIYLNFLGLVKFDIPPRLRMIFDHGNKLHDQYTNYFSRMGILISSEKTISISDPPIRGRMDAVIRGVNDNLEYIVEIKSISSSQYKLLKNKPKPDHLVQWNLYSYITGIPRGHIFYIIKDDTIEPKALLVKRDDKIIDETLNKLNYVYRCVNLKKVPVRCDSCIKSCSYHKECDKLDKEMQVLENNDIGEHEFGNKKCVNPKETG